MKEAINKSIMNKRLFLILSAFLLLFSLIEKGWTIETYRPETSVAGFIQLPGSGRQVYNFNPGWRFFKGDIRGAESVDFDDCSWTIVSTPHTVELMPAVVTIKALPGIASISYFLRKPKENRSCSTLRQRWESKSFT